MSTLLVAILAPAAAALLSLSASRHDDRAATNQALLMSVLLAIYGCWLPTQLGIEHSLPWFTLWGTEATVQFALSATSLGVWMAALSLWLGPVAILLGNTIQQRKGFHVGVFSLQAALVGAFLAADLAVFYVFFEATLIPALYLVARYGDRATGGQAAQRFFLYTMAGSMLMLVAIWYLAAVTGTLQISQLAIDVPALSGTEQVWLALAFVLAFAVKTPLVPFHGWQAPLYQATPAGGLVLIAGVMGKLGTYGFAAIVLPLFATAVADWAWILASLGIIGVIAGSIQAMRAAELRHILAFSSVAHLGMLTAAVLCRRSG